MTLRTRYSKIKRVKSHVGGESRTQQHFKDDCDINNIMDKAKNGMPLVGIPGRGGQAKWGDFTQVTDFHSAQNAILDAEDKFYSLPAKIRKMFDNNPAFFLEFVQNPENEEKCVELGLIQKTKEAENPPKEDKKEDLPNPNDKKEPIPENK